MYVNLMSYVFIELEIKTFDKPLSLIQSTIIIFSFSPNSLSLKREREKEKGPTLTSLYNR